MEEKILNILLEIQGHLKEHDKRFEQIDSRFEQIDSRFDKIEREIKILGDQLHAEIQVVNDNVEALRQDFNVVEMVTSKNALDISKLKISR